MTEKAERIMRDFHFCIAYCGQPIVAIPQGEMKRLCEHVAELEAECERLRVENAELKSDLLAAQERY